MVGYEPVPQDVPRTAPTRFWIVYAVCCLAGLAFLEPMLAHLLWGRPGDRVVGSFVLTSAAVVISVVGVGYWTRLRRLRSAYSLVIAGATGLAAFLPAYAALYLIS